MRSFGIIFALIALFSGCAAIKSGELKNLEGILTETPVQFFYPSQGGRIEGYLLRPEGTGPFPLAVLLHGHSFRRVGATRVLPVAERLTEELCYATLAISLPGYGESSLTGNDSDRELIKKIVVDGVAGVRGLTWIDGSRTLLYGFSRGAVFAAAMAGALPDLRGLVLHSGAYDLPRLYQETESPWVRSSLNPNGEVQPALFSILPEATTWSAPTLILHGANDRMIPANQALLLSDRLRTLAKPHRAVIFPDAGHRLPPDRVKNEVLSFLKQNVGTACAVSGP